MPRSPSSWHVHGRKPPRSARSACNLRARPSWAISFALCSNVPLGLVGGRFGQILLTEGGDLVVHYTTNVPPRELGLRFGLHDSVSGLAVQERRPVIVPDVSQAAYYRGRAQRARPPCTARTARRPTRRSISGSSSARRSEFERSSLRPLWGARSQARTEHCRHPQRRDAARRRLHGEPSVTTSPQLAEQRGDAFCEALDQRGRRGPANAARRSADAPAGQPSASCSRSTGTTWSSLRRRAASRWARGYQPSGSVSGEVLGPQGALLRARRGCRNRATAATSARR